MKEQVLDLLRTKYDAISFEDLMNALQLNTSEEISELQEVLNELVYSLDLYVTKKNKYILLEKMSNFRTGIIDVKEKGFGFLF